jgi:hypothetical protein
MTVRYIREDYREYINRYQQEYLNNRQLFEIEEEQNQN